MVLQKGKKKMNKLLPLVVIVSFFIVLGDLHAGETPRSTVLLYIENLKAGDIDAAFRQRLDGGAGVSKKNREIASVLMSGARIVSIETSYNTAMVYISVRHPITGERMELPMKLVKRNGNWKIANQAQ